MTPSITPNLNNLSYVVYPLYNLLYDLVIIAQYIIHLYSICQKDDLSGERWHCTANACIPGCYYNGDLYSISSQLVDGSNDW